MSSHNEMFDSSGKVARVMNMARFDGKVILISGGARGQGAAEARQLVKEGAQVVIGDVLEEQGRMLVRELGDAATFVLHDVTSPVDWDRAVHAAEERGGLHGLVNNAGIFQPKTLMETDLALWERHLRVNQTGCFLGMKTAVPALERAGGGAIVNISSTAGLHGSAPTFAYSATKWAIRGMTKSAALDLASKNIRVNSVHPGPIDTDMLNVRTPEQNSARSAQVPLKRQGTVDEVAQLVLFLLSGESAYITGAEIAIDGGVSA
ncbi:3-alpha-(or 20-beta)-hydroxysteroid dehydrogenase [Paraburkholderia piptadeniae]|uniref:3-alpha-(Or 20-beta)-hydroxysteroid dehydrogenase n=1 Tax=Paraburkholderia piptadeniae TaxID=1701573 RepID=A0A1N7SE49_9BURK|nr:3-alpha-(or 20-beta)-hydroxysteroid dehydrogenase [Paraburkholderia piptadeniae]